MIRNVSYSMLVSIEKLAFFNKQLKGFIISLRESSQWRGERCFLIILYILDKLGLETLKNSILLTWLFLGLFALASVLIILETSWNSLSTNELYNN